MSHPGTRNSITAFFEAKAYGVVGVSGSRKKFGNIVYRTMKQKEFVVYPVHPALDVVEGDSCFRSVGALPADATSVITVVPPEQTERVVEECAAKGVHAVWMQPGSQSASAIARAQALGMTVIQGECILMFLEPVTSVHALHRWIRKLTGSYPH